MIKFLRSLEQNFHFGRATLIIAVFTLLSRIMGFARDLLLAKQFGLSPDLDVYFTAFRIPDLVYNFLILGTLSVAFIPVFSKYYLKDKERAARIANTILNAAFLGMTAICILLFILAKPLTKLIVPGFSPEQIAQTASLTRLMLLSPIIFTISNVYSSVLISLKKFIVVNIAPLLYNLGIIVGIIFFYPRFGLSGLAYGVLLGALFHVLIQVPEAARFGFSWRPQWAVKDEGVKKVGQLFLPRIVGMDISYVNLIIVSVVGSVLTAGSIAAFNFANNIQAVALGIFALSTIVVVFPLLSEQYSKADIEGFIGTIQQSAIRIMFFIIPITIMILLFRAHAVRLLLGYGKCDWSCTILTFNTLGVLAFSLIAQSLTPLFARAFYARQNTRTPVAIGLIAMVVNAAFSYWLAQALGVVGIALGFMIASFVNCVLLFSALHRSLAKEAAPKILQLFSYGLVRAAVKIIIASIGMGAVSYLLLYLIGPLFNTHTVIGLFLQAAVSGSGGILVFLIIGYYLGLREANYVATALTNFRHSTMRFLSGS
jgi:putative peptidoglycan lipid II flippase